MTVFLVIIYPGSYNVTQLALASPFLALGLAHLISFLYRDKIFVSLLVAFAILNVGLYYHITRMPAEMVYETNHPGLIKLNQLINKNFKDHYVVIVVDWGLYYIQSLYGSLHQCVLFIDPMTRSDIQKIKEVLIKTKRKALFVGRADCFFFSSEFPHLKQFKIPFEVGAWEIRYES